MGVMRKMRKFLIQLLIILNFCFSGLSLAQETSLLAQGTENSVVLRWFLPDNYFPDNGFTIEKTGPNGELSLIEIASPMPQELAIASNLVSEGEYSELVEVFTRTTNVLSEEDAANEAFGRVALALGTFTRSGWAQVLGTFYEDMDVQIGETYTYRLLATTQNIPIVMGEAQAIVAPQPPLPNVQGVIGSTDSAGINLRWDLIKEGLVVGYKVYRIGPDGQELDLAVDGLFITEQEDPYTGELVLPEVFLQDSEVLADTTYSYTVSGITVFGQETPRSEPLEVFFPDPVGLEVPLITAVDTTDNALELFWVPPTDERVIGIGVVRYLDPLGDFELLTPNYLPPNTASYLDDSVDGGVHYYYGLITVDKNGREFGPSPVWAARGINLDAPSAPSNLRLEPSEESLKLTWDASPEKDVLGYQVLSVRDDDLQNLVLLTEEYVLTTTYTLDVPAGTLNEFGFVVRAVNTSFVESAVSNVAKGRLIDKTPPDRPLLADIQAREGSVWLEWAFTSNPDITTYRVLRNLQGEEDFIVIKEGLSAKTFEIIDEDVTPGLVHTYTIEAIDASDNVSEQAFALSATPFDLTAPKAVQAVSATLSEGGGVQVAWQLPPNEEVLFFIIERSRTLDGSFVQVSDILLPDNLEFVDASGREGLFYRVIAIDPAGNFSLPSEVVEVGP